MASNGKRLKANLENWELPPPAAIPALLPNYDIFAQCGVIATAVFEGLRVKADGEGELVVIFTPVVGNALLNGIEVIP